MPFDAPPRVLAIHAHPDDVELQCAGTLALLKDAGCEIVVATMTAGDKGSAELDPDQTAAVRRREAAAAANLLGAEYHCLGILDLEVAFVTAQRRAVTEVVRKARADLVLTAPPIDYMADHEVTSRLVRDACFAAPIPNYVTGGWDPAPLLARIPHLYFVDPIHGTDWYGQPVEPQFTIDVTATFERKIEMLACHASQRDWLRRQHGIDEYLEGCRRFGRRRGAAIDAEYGEGFRQYVGHPYPEDNLLLKLLHQTG